MRRLFDKMVHRLGRCARGSMAVEFAIAAPILVTAVVGLADLGFAVNERMRLVSAVRAGVQAATLHPDDEAAARSAVEKAAPQLVAARLTVTLGRSCGCADGTAIACGATCAVGIEQRFVTVRVAENYPMMFNYPGLGSTLALAADATLRY